MSVTSVFAQTTGSSTKAGDMLQSSATPSFTPIPGFSSLPPLDVGIRQQSSALVHHALIVQKLLKKHYRSDEQVNLSVVNPDNTPVTVSVLTNDGKKANITMQQSQDTNTLMYKLTPSTQFRPGKYTLMVTDANGISSEQDFTWGVLSVNSDRSVYLPGQMANLSMAVLDNGGNMVCDAQLDLKITNTTLHISDDLSTDNRKIIVNQQCQSHNFSLKPDYEAHYQIASTSASGTYTMVLTAKSNYGSYTISDKLTVSDTVPFDVERVSATRIYPPNNYPVQFNVTANRDFDGKVTETVPESFTITASDNANSYNSMQTLYMNPFANPVKSLDKEVLGASTSALLLPFTGSFPITEGFGAEQTDPALRLFYARYGLAGHDGVDFGLPIGTPVRTVDDGTVLLAGQGDYGITIVIQHAWGKSYYGHLSQVTVRTGQLVGKGQQIGFSGNTGEATGPHLHFGMKPNIPDMQNGYYGKVDPLAYFNLPATAQVAIGPDTIASSSAVLGVSTSAQQENDPVTPPGAITESVQEVNDHLVTQKLQSEILDAKTTENADKVKVITWNVSLKKGQSVSLGYTFKAPQVSPQFYLLGPLRFYDNTAPASAQDNSTTPVFAETRQWQIAADKVGDPWYKEGTDKSGFAWQYRKQITIDHTKVTNTNTPSLITFMEPGTDATQGLEFYNTTDCFSSTTVAHTGPRSISCNAGNQMAKTGILADAGRRISFYLYISAFPTTDDGIVELDTNAAVQIIRTLGVQQSSHKLYSPKSGTVGNTVLQTGQWYHISLSYTITSTTVNQFKVFLNGSQEFSDSNITLPSTGSDELFFGRITGSGGSAPFYFDDLYVDNGADLSDPGEIRVTNKRPNANGAANNFTNRVGAGGSGYGSGHSPQVNEQPLSTTNGWARNLVANVRENYGIENASTGDVNISSANLIADDAWVYASASASCLGQITNNGNDTPIGLITSNAMYTNIATNSAYPANAATVGMQSCTSTQGVTLSEAGMLIAYFATGGPPLPNFPVLVSLPSDADLAANAGATPVRDATSSAVFDTSTNDFTWNHTVTSSNGSNLLLMVSVVTTSSSTTVTSVTFNGVGLTNLTAQNCPANCRDEVWYLIGPATGKHLIEVKTSASAAVTATATSFYNVNQTTPLGTASTTNGTSTSSTVSPTTSSYQLVADFYGNRALGPSYNPAPDSSQTLQTDVGDGTAQVAAVSTKPSSGTSTTLKWSWTTSQDYADIAVGINPAPNDILFTSQDGQTKLDHEIENYNSNTGELEAWVRIPSLSSTADTIIYMYYGNASATDQSNKTGVWDSNYKAVYHMKETPRGTAPQDSTSTGANGTYTGPWASYQQMPGQIDGSIQFQATRAASVTLTNIAALDSQSQMTMEMWFKPTTTTTGFQGMLYAGGSVGYLQNDGPISSDCPTLSTHTTAWDFDIGAWNLCTHDGAILAGRMDQVVGVFDGTQSVTSNRARIYVDGLNMATQDSSTFGTTTPASMTWDMGNSTGNSTFTDGIIDEIRFSNSARSQSWITTEFNNTATPSAFFTLGSTDDVPSGTSVETKAYAPTMDLLMRGGKYFYNSTVQPYTF